MSLNQAKTLKQPQPVRMYLVDVVITEINLSPDGIGKPVDKTYITKNLPLEKVVEITKQFRDE